MNDHDQIMLQIHNQLQDALAEPGTKEELQKRIASILAFIKSEIRPEIAPTEEEFVRHVKFVDD